MISAPMSSLAAPSPAPWLEPPRALFVTDLDGTLLDSSGSVAAGNLAALGRAEAAGVAVAIVTGRRRSTIGEIHGQLAPRRYRFSTSNGAVILGPDHASPEAVLALPWDGVEALARLPGVARARILCITLPPVRDRDAGMPVDLAVVEPSLDRWSLAPTAVEPEGWAPADRDEVRAHPLVHLAIWVASREEAERLEPAVREVYGAVACVHSVVFPRTRTGLCEVVPPGGKANALRHLAERLGVPLRSTGAVGDDMNDAAMLDAAAHRFAVGGSTLAQRRPDATRVAAADGGAVADAIDRFVEAIR
jgi:hypothetical protein